MLLIRLSSGAIILGLSKLWFGNTDGEIIEVGGYEKVIYRWGKYAATPVYHWEKWSTSSKYSTSLSTYGSTVSSLSLPQHEYEAGWPTATYHSVTAYTSYEINTTTGVVTLSGRTAAYVGRDANVQINQRVYTNSSVCVNGSEEEKLQPTTTIYRTDEIVASISSTNGTARNAVPMRPTKSTIKGDTSYGDVTSTNDSEYPQNGASGNYWYVKQTEITYQPGDYLDEVSSDNASAYPNNGYSNGYWYVLIT